MKLLCAIVLATLTTGPAVASEPAAQPSAMVCMTPTGRTVSPICERSSTVLLSKREACTCPMDQEVTPVTAPFCAKGEVGVGNSVAAGKARREAAKDGSLYGDSFKDRPFCVPAPR